MDNYKRVWIRACVRVRLCECASVGDSVLECECVCVPHVSQGRDCVCLCTCYDLLDFSRAVNPPSDIKKMNLCPGDAVSGPDGQVRGVAYGYRAADRRPLCIRKMAPLGSALWGPRSLLCDPSPVPGRL